VKYALLIYGRETERANASSEQMAGVLEDYGKFTAELDASGANLGGEALDDSTTATTVRVREGETLTTDGPFAETHEQLGGFYLVEAPDLDEAIAIAARLPGSWTGSVEVRPIFDWSTFTP